MNKKSDILRSNYARKLELATMQGLLIIVVGLVISQSLASSVAISLVEWSALLIVVMGTLGAVILGTKSETLATGVAMLKWVVFAPADDRDTLVEKAQLWAKFIRKNGTLKADALMSEEQEILTRKGFQLISDNVAPDKIQEILEEVSHQIEQAQKKSAKIWQVAGGFAPTIGIIGAVLGLVQVLGSMSDTSGIGPGVAQAFIATLYGVGLANLVFLPIFNKLSEIIQSEAVRRDLQIEAIVSIAKGENSHTLSDRLASYTI